ncbi:hypothetical protein SCARD494_01930 [Seiridium cardinale]
MRKPTRIISPPQSLPDKKRFQSTLEAVKSPPSTYLSAATDILGGLDIIPSKISNNTYSSTDIFLLANSANDGHFSLDLCSLSIFASSLQAQTIASVSKAGLALSELYLFEDVQYIDSTNSTTVNVSSVANINGVDTFEYVPNIADLRRSQDPDSRWNQLYPSSAVLAAYDSTVIEFSEFSNGSNLTLETHASSAGSSFNVSSGEDVYKAARSNIIINASGNGGGIIYRAFDLFRLFLPAEFPYSATRLRVHDAFAAFATIYGSLNPSGYRGQIEPDPLADVSSEEEFLACGTQLKSTSGHFSPTSTLPRYMVKKIRFMDLDLRTPSESATPPLKEEDILIVSDGICVSTCTTFANLITNAGGVRALAFEVVHDKNRCRSGRIFQNAIAGGIDLLTPDELEHLNPSILQPLEQFPPTLSGNLNFCDAYQERNPDLPLQFEYPAADCRLFYTYKNIRNPATTWLAASQAIRDNGSCVPASTGSRDLCRVVRTPTGGGDNSPGGGGVETSTVAFPAFSAYAFVFLLITVSWCLV